MKRLITFGCSNTEGQGLDNPEVEVWGAVLARHLGRKFVNKGRQGASNKYIAYSIEQFNFLPDDFVIISWSFLDRYSILHDPNDFEKDDFESTTSILSLRNRNFITDIHHSNADNKLNEVSGTYYHLFHNDYDSNFINKVFIDYSIDLLLYKQIEFKQIYFSRVEYINCRNRHLENFPFYFLPFFENYPKGTDDQHMGKEGNKALGDAMYQHIVNK